MKAKKVTFDNKIDYIKAHISLTNELLPVQLTGREVEFLAHFLALEGDLVENDRFCTAARKLVRERMKISNQQMSNLLKQVTDKGFVRERDGHKYILPLISPDGKVQRYNIEFTYEPG